ncbi:MAG: hypothetical protein ACXAC7_20220 [Candidatus Hodarchaeales archaeon]|jgi:hypothetical protein
MPNSVDSSSDLSQDDKTLGSSQEELQSGVKPQIKFSDYLVENLSQMWYCKEDYSKYVELIAGYSQNNTGLFHINPSKIDRDIENAINMRKLRNTEEDLAKVHEIINIICSENPSVNDLTLVQVECPICSKVTVAPKLPRIYANKKIRNNQLKVIDQYIKQQTNKYWPRNLALKNIASVIIFAVVLLIIVSIIIY